MTDSEETVGGRPLNPTAASLLGFLHDGPMTGWDLVACAQARIGDFWTLTPSQVYRELAAMADRGLIEAGTPGPRDRKPYSLTRAGRSAFATWIDQEPGLESIRFPLLLTLAFSGHLRPERLHTIMRRHRELHANRLAGYQRQYEAAMQAGAGQDSTALATLRFGLRYEEAVLDWFDELDQGDPNVASDAPTP